MSAGPVVLSGVTDLVAELAHWQPTEAAQEAARLRAADVACAALLGQGLPEWQLALRAFVRLLGPRPDGAAWGAVLASGCRITEIDDIELRTCTTPGSVAVPAALAVSGEEVDAAAVLAGIGAGYEVVVRAAEVLGGAFAPSVGTWPTRAVAPLGAAAAAGRTLGLPPEAMVDACALAAGSAITGVCPEPARAVTLGMAVAQGITAAVAAAEGLRGDRRMLERWPQAHNRAEGLAPAEPGAAVTTTKCKPYAAARQVLAGSAALRDLVESGGLPPADVVSVELGVPPLHAAMVDRPEVRHRLDTLASAQYQLGAALSDPGSLDALDHAVPPDSGLLERMATVHVVPDPDLARAFPDRWGARLVVELRDGEVRHLVDAVPGGEEFGWEALMGKVRRLAAAGGGGHPGTRGAGVPAGGRSGGVVDRLADVLEAARSDRWTVLRDSVRTALTVPGGGAS